jgi:hypothetical protein
MDEAIRIASALLGQDEAGRPRKQLGRLSSGDIPVAAPGGC